ncbi:MAG TPA: hypothetical protein VLE46_17970 [Nitrospira sp.]|nr:hypothetical protein [Nitrospira sp.]
MIAKYPHIPFAGSGHPIAFPLHIAPYNHAANSKLDNGPAIVIKNSDLGLAGSSFHMRDAAEDEESNAFHGDAESPGDH